MKIVEIFWFYQIQLCSRYDRAPGGLTLVGYLGRPLSVVSYQHLTVPSWGRAETNSIKMFLPINSKQQRPVFNWKLVATIWILCGWFCVSEGALGTNDSNLEVQCSPHYLDYCLSMLPKMVNQSILKRMPVTENEIDSLCHGFATEMECFDRYAKKCLVPHERQLIDIHSSGAKNIFKYLCNDKSFRKEYLTHSRCFKGTQEDWESCVRQFIKLFREEIQNKNLSQETRILHTCCAIHGFSRCVFVPGSMKCEREDALFLLKLTEISIDRQKYYRDCRAITNYTICLGVIKHFSLFLLVIEFLFLRANN